MTRKFAAALLLIAIAVPAAAEQTDRPNIASDDTWTYQVTAERNSISHKSREQITVLRAGPSEILVSAKDPDSSAPAHELLVGADWSRMRNVDGKQTVVHRPLAFPLFAGKAWAIDYTEANPQNRARKNEHVHEACVVSGWETVSVPAGTFKAMKIEVNRQWAADVTAPAVAASRANLDSEGSTAIMQTRKATMQHVSAKDYLAFWYVPEVKRFVKSDEEHFGPNDVLVERFVEAMESYKVSP